MKNRYKVAPSFAYFLILIFLALVLRFFWFFNEPKTVIPRSQKVTFVATVKEVPKVTGKWQVLSFADVKVYLDKYPGFEVGDRVKVSGEVDDGGQIFQAKVQKIGQEKTFGAYFSSLRTEISGKIMGLLPNREATLVVGSVLGVDSVDAGFRQVLKKTGTIHVVVVSGQNMAIVAGIFVGMAGAIGRRRAMLLAVLATFLYSALAGFSPPVLRAAIMVLASSLAVFFGRELAAVGGLFLSAYIILFAWPEAIFSLSFQLTFAASFGIMTLGKKMEYMFTGSVLGVKGPVSRQPRPTSSLQSDQNFVSFNVSDAAGARRGAPTGTTLSKFLALLVSNAAVATSAYLFTAPLILYNFGSVSLFAPLANILAVEAVFPVMILGFAVAVFSVIYLPIAQMLAYFAYVPAFYFVRVVELFAKIPAGQITTGENSLFFVVGAYGLLLVGTFWGKVKGQKAKGKSASQK